MTTKSFFAAAVLFFVIAPALSAQDASVLGAGTRVKLVAPVLDAAQQTATIVSATRDSISFRSDSYPVTRSLAVADLTSIYVSGGKETHRGRDALYGLLLGSGAGLAIGSATYKKPENCYFLCTTHSDATTGGAVAGGLAGTLIGAYLFGSFDKSERWVPLRETASIRLAPLAGGAALAVSARF